MTDVPSPNLDLRKLTLADVDPAADVMAQAYVDDPLCSLILPIRRTRTKTLYKLFRVLGALSVREERVYGIGDPLEAVAYWRAPGQPGLSVSVRSIGIFIPLIFTLYPIGLMRARAINDQIDKMHKKYVQEPHFYLDNIGVLPSSQGRGLSSKLIRPTLEQADSKGVVVYTDTVTQGNVALYERFGFECVDEASVSGTGITIWALRRPGRGPTS